MNRTSNCMNATFDWGTTVTMSNKCGGNFTKDYLHWDAGDLTGYHRIMDIKIYNIS